MGLTSNSTGKNIINNEFKIQCNKNDYVIALAGNPNVGKSTVFNHLTGMKQHTGNWTGKTVQNAQGKCSFNNNCYVMVDIPGTYSLMAHSIEEEVARDFICFGDTDAIIVVCDATCLERNLNLVLQIIEITNHTVVCVNLLDEAKKKKINVDLEKLSKILGVDVFGVTARSGEGLSEMMEKLPETILKPRKDTGIINYNEYIEHAIEILSDKLSEYTDGTISDRWTAIRLLDNDDNLIKSICQFSGIDLINNNEICKAKQMALEYLSENGIDSVLLKDNIISSIIISAEKIANECVTLTRKDYYKRDRLIDRVITHKIWGVPIMAFMLLLIFWITIAGANYPSEILFSALFELGDKLSGLLHNIGAPLWLNSMLIDGIYRVIAWVTSVMLPPMAIFFPLFTFLEDLGYLPRVAFNLDKYFKKAGACGKQSLTMAMDSINLYCNYSTLQCICTLSLSISIRSISIDNVILILSILSLFKISSKA